MAKKVEKKKVYSVSRKELCKKFERHLTDLATARSKMLEDLARLEDAERGLEDILHRFEDGEKRVEISHDFHDQFAVVQFTWQNNFSDHKDDYDTAMIEFFDTLESVTEVKSK